MSTSTLENICIPINLDAFILNQPVCETTGPAVLIAPITQPDYVALRLDNSVIQHDVLPAVDLHSSRPAVLNPRVSSAYSTVLKTLDLKDPEPTFSGVGSELIQSRLGVYLHWSLARGYRSGTSAADGTVRHDPSDPSKTNIAVGQQPTFRLVPNRWLIVRSLDPDQYLPTDATPPLLDAWVIESDRNRKIESLPGDIDLETEVTPFVVYNSTPSDKNLLHSQAEQYIGFRSKSLVTDSYVDSSADAQAQHVQLSVMNSSNPVFADYTIHNPNVFSLKDNFEYAPGKYLTKALCNYVVVGWHSSLDDGPLGKNGIQGAFSQRISDFLCKLDPSVTDPKILDSTDSTPILSHGAIYGVLYDANNPPDTPANKYAEMFTDMDDSNKISTTEVGMEPIAVGTTPLDAVLTFLHAHRDDTQMETSLFGPRSSETAKTLLDMAELLYASGDDYDSRIKAHDLIQAQNFTTTLGGFTWHYDRKKDQSSPPQAPSTKKDSKTNMSELDYLNTLNDLQRQLDITERMYDISRWQLFAEFFKYCSDVENKDGSRKQMYADNFKKLYVNSDSYIKSLNNTTTTLQNGINNIIAPAPAGTPPLIQVKKSANDPFQQRTDPSLLIAGLDSGWPAAFLDRLQIRFDSDFKPSTNVLQKPPVAALLPGILSNLNIVQNVSGDIKSTINKLLLEAFAASPKVDIGFKNWQGQPFCPIFVEWEAQFYNVDYLQDPNPWAVALGSSPMSNNNQKQVRYINPTQLSEPSKLADQDVRAVSGRILVLPQPSFALSAIVKQVLNVAGVNVPDSLQQEVKDPKTGKMVKNGKLDPDKLNAFVTKVEALKFISGDLMGFTDGLLTLATGSHVQPVVRVPGQASQALAAAVDIGLNIDQSFTTDVMTDIIGLMDSQTAKTPYGTMVDFSGASHQPFKGVQHGQLVLTSLVIVDKFGQAIACPLPAQQPTTPPTIPAFHIHPCLADQLCPTVLDQKGTTLNTVFPISDDLSTSGMVLSPFIQITPAINQAARINASFLTKSTDSNSPPWRECNDWDNPIFGWIIVNYADSALQFFTGDGLFFTSLQFGGPTGTIKSLQWEPFATPPDPGSLVTQQLIDLINQLTATPDDPEQTKKAQQYLRALWHTIDGAIENMPFPPSQYSAYANAIVGKPLALVNVGWSLELAEAPMKSQQTTGALPNPSEEETMSKYNFHVKIGDFDRPYDGVVCYWDTDDNTMNSTGKTTYRPLYTYNFDPETDAGETSEEKTIDPRADIQPGDPPNTPSNFPTISPYFIDPTTVDAKVGLQKTKAQKYMVKTLLIDPYTPFHLYSAVLPTKSLKLPGWTLEAAMRNMTAFFTIGPMLVTKDVRKTYDTSNPLTASSWLDTQNTENQTQTQKLPPINLPIAGGKGMWNWLQPYVDPAPAPSGAPIRPLYNAMEVGQETGALRDDPAPYTMLEGYLQLAAPLIDKTQLGQ
ncbi:uncharacterized protein PAC_18230 [Phialocephala subalpina]|uniref:Uncharacterized protein n=1 Tax=Phialocephala subalpina TaxID=576137 RepID=A0A1L7XTG6_9HELO|nr:uncharacterized protein PAC_18230 [Phialocephala subalpina]